MTIPNTNIKNQTVIYNDNIIAFDSSLQLTSVENIKEDLIKQYIEKIIKENPDIIFDTIQYSKEKETLYFYTNSKLYRSCKEQIKTGSDLLTEIRGIIEYQGNNDYECISLCTLEQILKIKKMEYEKIKNYYEKYLNKIIKKQFKNYQIKIYGFDYDKNELLLNFSFFNQIYQITVTKEEKNLIIKQNTSLFNNNILISVISDLSKLYDELLNFKDYSTEYCYNVKPINSNFLINISKYGISVFNDSEQKTFVLTSKNSLDNNVYEYESEYEIIKKLLYGNEDKIFEKIYVKIEDCPSWSKAQLLRLKQERILTKKKNLKSK